VPSDGRLLALDRTRVAREEAEVAQLAAVRLVDLHEGTRHGETERTGLAVWPPPLTFAFTSYWPSCRSP
jgi:hypothetical protein